MEGLIFSIAGIIILVWLWFMCSFDSQAIYGFLCNLNTSGRYYSVILPSFAIFLVVSLVGCASCAVITEKWYEQSKYWILLPVFFAMCLFTIGFIIGKYKIAAHKLSIAAEIVGHISGCSARDLVAIVRSSYTSNFNHISEIKFIQKLHSVKEKVIFSAMWELSKSDYPHESLIDIVDLYNHSPSIRMFTDEDRRLSEEYAFNYIKSIYKFSDIKKTLDFESMACWFKRKQAIYYGEKFHARVEDMLLEKNKN